MKPGQTNQSLLAGLTPAERRVAAHVVDGLSNKEIAGLLVRAESTVKHQVAAILRASRLESRGRFIAAYYKQFLPPSPGGTADSAWATPGPGANHPCLVGGAAAGEQKAGI